MEIHVADAEAKLPRLDRSMWAGLLGAPGIWVLEVILSRVLSAQACSGDAAMFDAAHAGSMNVALFSVSSAAIAAGLLCAVLATRGFVLSNAKQIAVDGEDSGDAVLLLPPQKLRRSTRKRSVALCSAVVGGGCAIGLLFTVLAEVFRGFCGF